MTYSSAGMGLLLHAMYVLTLCLVAGRGEGRGRSAKEKREEKEARNNFFRTHEKPFLFLARRQQTQTLDNGGRSWYEVDLHAIEIIAQLPT